jgi:hypothetical protein
LSIDEKNYSDYIQHLSNVMSIMALTSGFLFTAYTILITALPDPSSITAQSTLLVVSIYLSICTYCLATFAEGSIACCRNTPPLTRNLAATNLLFLFAGTTSMATAIILMSLLWNLTYLAIAQSIQWALYAMAIYLFIIRHNERARTSLRFRELKS